MTSVYFLYLYWVIVSCNFHLFCIKKQQDKRLSCRQSLLNLCTVESAVYFSPSTQPHWTSPWHFIILRGRKSKTNIFPYFAKGQIGCVTRVVNLNYIRSFALSLVCSSYIFLCSYIYILERKKVWTFWNNIYVYKWGNGYVNR